MQMFFMAGSSPAKEEVPFSPYFFFLGHGDYMKEELGTVKETFSEAMVFFHIASSNRFLLRLWMKTLS